MGRHPTGDVELIQVCADAREAAVSERELRALLEAGRLYPKAIRRLLTATLDGLPAALPEGVVGQTAYEWMLSRDPPEL